MVVTKNHPHVVVTSTNRATFGGDKALSAQISLVFSVMVVTSAGFGGDKAPPAQTSLIFSGMLVTSAGFGGEEHSVLGPLRRLLNRTFNPLVGRPPGFRGKSRRRLQGALRLEVGELLVARDLKWRQVRVLHLER